ncbi:class I SAM-dependent methyltransferase [Streptomyces sp. NPDC056500]|uniref:class I SAM-dependent methyltransferase n=1 Tax=Streptomyces sp. NPDC056500 TaxID=3345840 RepID=UPI003698E91D
MGPGCVVLEPLVGLLIHAGRPNPDASFDVVLLMESACHCEDKTRALREVRRVLVPGGRMVLEDVLTARGADPGRWDEVNRLIPVSFITSDAWSSLLEPRASPACPCTRSNPMSGQPTPLNWAISPVP